MKVTKLGTTTDYVYDISLDGTVVNSLGINVLSNTDGFNFSMPSEFRYTEEHPYISNGRGRNSKEGKAYVGVEADVAEFEDMYFNTAYNGGTNKSGLGIDEFCDACIQFARKNYADLMPDGSTKKVGNTIKSRKMSGYLEAFIDDGINKLLHGDGKGFLDGYYEYIRRIYNYQIPIKDIASKGNIKKSLNEYKADCKTLTKAGTKKSRQAWYELAIKEGLSVNVGDTVYYINTGVKKSQSDVKRVTRFVKFDENGDKVDLTKDVEKLYKAKAKEAGDAGVEFKQKRLDFAREVFGKDISEEDEIILNCKLVPQEIMDKEEDVLCSEYEGLEYNVEKYIDQFNNRVKPLLVCFSPEIRNNILITNPLDEKFFTDKESELVCGFPNKEGDQDTFEALMKPEAKEIEFWLKVGERPPFVDECGIDWDGLVSEYVETRKEQENELFQEENTKYLLALEELTDKEYSEFEDDGKIPASITKIVTLDSDMHFYFKKIPSMTPSTGGFIFDDLERPVIETKEG